MKDRLYYLLAFLPVLPPLGELPPIDAEEIFAIARDERIEKARAIAGIFEYQSRLAKAAQNRLFGYIGEDDEIAYQEEMPQPVLDALRSDLLEIGEDAWLTQLWMKHFDYLKSIGKSLGSDLLSHWVDWEISLKRQLAELRIESRSKALGDESIPAGGVTGMSAIESGSSGENWDHGNLIAQWRDADDPMVGERILDEARMEFIDKEAKRYSFGIDELVAYFLKLGLLSRYVKLNREEGLKILEEVTAL